MLLSPTLDVVFGSEYNAVPSRRSRTVFVPVASAALEYSVTIRPFGPILPPGIVNVNAVISDVDCVMRPVEIPDRDVGEATI